ncbi:MAG: copper-binding protein [Rhizobiales bacterium]|nr:copper-binding protein [Hyphomicrobiales bacterium]
MKQIIKTGLSVLVALTISVGAWAAEYSQGVVRSIDTEAGKVTVAHGPLKNLDMPAMTMIFRVSEEAMLTSMSEGDEIEFVVERRNGKLTIIELN